MSYTAAQGIIIIPLSTMHVAAKIPLAHLRTYFVDCAKTAPHIVSVGCGSGYVEAFLTANVDDDISRSRLVLVDPQPMSFNKIPVLPVHYSTVNELLVARPEVFRDCLLLLIWSDPDDSTYDYDAVMALEPKSILVLHERPGQEPNGSAAGRKMHGILREPAAYDYRLVCETVYTGRSLNPVASLFAAMGAWQDFSQVRITWLAKRGSAIPKKRQCHGVQALVDAMKK